MELNPEILTHLAYIKLTLAIGGGILVYMLVRGHKTAWHYMMLLAGMFAVLTFLIVWPQNTFLFGNTGDELYMGANLMRMVAGQYGQDLYYASFPPYYPPLWFWIVGALSSPFAQHGLVAYKIGAIVSIACLFVGVYGWLALAERLKLASSHPAIRVLIPLCVTLMIPFDAIIGKPHQALSAIFSVLLTSVLISQFKEDAWTRSTYLFLSVTAALILMTYYFWGFVMLPVFILFVLVSRHRFLNSMRLIRVGLLTFAFSSPYIIPLLRSLLESDISISQGTYFSLRDVLLFFPWHGWIVGLLFIVSIIGFIIFSDMTWIRGAVALVIGSYAYQILGVMLFVSGGTALLPSKPFVYLVGSSMAVGLAYGLFALHQISRAKPFVHQFAMTTGVVVMVIASPFVALADDESFIKRMNLNTLVPQEMVLVDAIAEHVPDYATRTWLSPTRPAVNTYLPLSYYISHNEHSSHFAAGFSDRLNEITSIASSTTAGDFFEATQKLDPPVDALFLFYDNQTDSYPLNFWVDNYPNGGIQYRIDLDEQLISEIYWDQRYHEWDWIILTRRDT